MRPGRGTPGLEKGTRLPGRTLGLERRTSLIILAEIANISDRPVVSPESVLLSACSTLPLCSVVYRTGGINASRSGSIHRFLGMS